MLSKCVVFPVKDNFATAHGKNEQVTSCLKGELGASSDLSSCGIVTA